MLHFKKLFLILFFHFCTFVVFAQPHFFTNPYFLGVYKKGPSFGAGLALGVAKNKHIFYFDFGYSSLKTHGDKNLANKYIDLNRFAQIMLGYNYCFNLSEKNSILLGAQYGLAAANTLTETTYSNLVSTNTTYQNGPLGLGIKASYNYKITRGIYASAGTNLIITTRRKSTGLLSSEKIPNSQNVTPTLQIGLVFR